MALVKVFLNFLVISAAFAVIPSYIHVCSRSDPQLAKCIIQSIDMIRPKLKEGIPELNVPTVEPLLLDDMKLKTGPEQAQISSDLSNLQLWGSSGVQVKQLKADIPNKIFIGKLLLPSLYIKGDYDININVLVLKYKGQGVLTGNFTDYMLDSTLKYEVVQNNGVDYMNFTKIEFKINRGKSVVDLGGLKNDNSVLAKGVDEVFKDNIDLFITELVPYLEKEISAKIAKIANNIVKSVPYDELYPK